VEAVDTLEEENKNIEELQNLGKLVNLSTQFLPLSPSPNIYPRRKHPKQMILYG
jgi:hypothetical protein